MVIAGMTMNYFRQGITLLILILAFAWGVTSAVAQQSPTATPLPSTARVVALLGMVDLRDVPFERSRVIRQIPGGTEVVILDVTAEGAWYRVRLADNRTGWLAAEFLTEIPPTATPSPADDVFRLTTLGEIEIIQGNYNQGLQLYTQAIEIDPSSALAYEGRGNAYFSLELYSQAIDDYTRALEIGSVNSQIYANRGLAYQYLGEDDLAFSDLDEAIKLSPYNVFAYMGRAIAYMAQGNHEDAITDLNQAILLDPDYAMFYFLRGVSLYYATKYAEALTDFNQAIELEAENADFYSWRGLSHIMVGSSSEEIRADFCRHIQLAGDNTFPEVINLIEQQGWECS
jgi:tetratricopeptide (TPR) repeat protein